MSLFIKLFNIKLKSNDFYIIFHKLVFDLFLINEKFLK